MHRHHRRRHPVARLLAGRPAAGAAAAVAVAVGAGAGAGTGLQGGQRRDCHQWLRHHLSIRQCRVLI